MCKTSGVQSRDISVASLSDSLNPDRICVDGFSSLSCSVGPVGKGKDLVIVELGPVTNPKAESSEADVPEFVFPGHTEGHGIPVPRTSPLLRPPRKPPDAAPSGCSSDVAGINVVPGIVPSKCPKAKDVGANITVPENIPVGRPPPKPPDGVKGSCKLMTENQVPDIRPLERLPSKPPDGDKRSDVLMAKTDVPDIAPRERPPRKPPDNVNNFGPELGLPSDLLKEELEVRSSQTPGSGFLVPVTINGFSTLATVDSGAMVTIVNEKLVEHFVPPPIHVKEIKL